MSRLKQLRVANESYRLAIDAGFASAEVYNNLGYSYLQQLRFAEARASLDKAIHLNGQLQAAFYNRAMVEFEEALGNTRKVSPAALDDIDRAIQCGPPTAELYTDAARLCSWQAADEAERLELALDYLESAVQCGADPRKLARDGFLAALSKEPRFQALVAQRASQAKPQPARRLLDALGEADFW